MGLQTNSLERLMEYEKSIRELGKIIAEEIGGNEEIRGGLLRKIFDYISGVFWFGSSSYTGLVFRLEEINVVDKAIKYDVYVVGVVGGKEIGGVSAFGTISVDDLKRISVRSISEAFCYLVKNLSYGLKRAIINDALVRYIRTEKGVAGVYILGDSYYYIGYLRGDIYVAGKPVILDVLVNEEILEKRGKIYVFTEETPLSRHVRKKYKDIYIGVFYDKNSTYYGIVENEKIVEALQIINVNDIEMAKYNVLERVLRRIYAGILGYSEELHPEACHVFLKLNGFCRNSQYRQYCKLLELISYYELTPLGSHSLMLSGDKILGLMLFSMIDKVFGKTVAYSKGEIKVIVRDDLFDKKQVYNMFSLTSGSNKLSALPSPEKLCRMIGGEKCSIEVRVGDNYYLYSHVYRVVKRMGEPDEIYLVYPRTGGGQLLALRYGDIGVVIAPLFKR